jgi:penicillin-binding protein 1A
MANQGREVKPSLIDYIQDRTGKVIFRNDTRCSAMDNCNARDWDGRPMPRPPLRTKQLMDPITAFQMVHILEGVITRGTAQNLRDLGRPVFGKTGTSTGPTNVWFVGGTPEVVAGVYMGFDQPRPMGHYAQGGRLAAPIFKSFAKQAFKDMPVVPFRAPQGVRMVRIDRRSGRKVYGGWPTSADPKSAVIWEAFKPESEPKRSASRYQVVDRTELLKERLAMLKRGIQPRQAAAARRSDEDSDFLQSEGGIY